MLSSSRELSSLCSAFLELTMLYLDATHAAHAADSDDGDLALLHTELLWTELQGFSGAADFEGWPPVKPAGGGTSGGGASEGGATGGAVGGARPKSLLLQPNQSCSSEAGNDGVRSPVQTQSSRLSKTLAEVLHDGSGGAVTCLLQYLEQHRAAHLLRLYLDAHSFQVTTLSRLQSVRGSRGQRAGGGAGSSSGAGGAGGVSSGSGSLSSASAPSLASSGASRKLSAASSASGECAGRSVDSGETCSAGVGGSDTGVVTASGVGSVGSAAAAGGLGGLGSSGTSGTTSETRDLSRDTDSAPSPTTTTTTAAGYTLRGRDPGVESAVPCGAGSPSSTHSAPTNPHAPTSHPTATVTHSADAVTHSREDSVHEKLKKSIAQDAVNIYQTYISQDAPHSVDVTDDIRNSTISQICREDGEVDPYCFSECQQFVVDRIQNEHFAGFIGSEFHCKHQVDLLTQTQVYLADILYNELALCYFMEYMDQEDARGLLQCFLDLDNFQQHLSSTHGHYDGMQAQSDAMVIYDKYFSLQATHPLGFSDAVRLEVESAICREEGPLPDCFAKPKHIVLRTLDKRHFQQYLQSDMYYKYLSDLITTVQTAQDMPPQYSRQRKGSDSQSDTHSVHSNLSNEAGVGAGGSKNTLLAGGVSSANATANKKVFKINDSDMRMDERLFNPDALWKRDQAGNMSLGKINELGHFVSDFDPEPDHEKKKKASGSSLLKKLRGQTENQELMAEQIAKMIIADITTLTSGEAGDEEFG